MFFTIVGALLFVFVGIPVLVYLAIRFWRIVFVFLVCLVLLIAVNISAQHLEDKKEAKAIQQFYEQLAREKAVDPLGVRGGDVLYRIQENLSNTTPEEWTQNYMCLQGC